MELYNNNTRMLNDDQYDRLITHYEVNWNNNKRIRLNDRKIDTNEIVVFMITHLRVDTQHLMVIKDDAMLIKDRLYKHNIFMPIL